MPIESTLSELKRIAGPALDQLSQRLWGERSRAGDGKRASIDNLIKPEEAEVFLKVLRTYAGHAQALPLAVLAAGLREGVPGAMAMESAAFLVTGTLALGVSGVLGVDSRDGLLDALMNGAFGLDDLSRELRELTLTGMHGWPEFPGGGPLFPDIGEGCLEGIRGVAGRAGAFIQSTTGRVRSPPSTLTVLLRSIHLKGVHWIPCAFSATFPRCSQPAELFSSLGQTAVRCSPR